MYVNICTHIREGEKEGGRDEERQE